MPEKSKSSTSNGAPGLSSINTTKTNETDVTKIGSRRRDDVKENTTPVKKTQTTKPTATTPATATKKAPAAATKPLAKTAQASKTTPQTTTRSSFSVGGSNYNIIDDNTTARKMIKWDEKGNIASDSPVIVVGKNAAGGFILAANDSVQGVSSSKFPYTQDKGINFPSLESDVAGGTPTMQTIHGSTYSDLSEVANPKATSLLRGIYRRTGQL
jgi:hypothetical protein